MSSNHEDVTAREIDEARLTAYALGQLSGDERAAAEAILARVAAARQSVQETAALAAHVRQAYEQAPAPEASALLREAIQKELSPTIKVTAEPLAADLNRRARQGWGLWVSAAIAATVVLAMLVPASLYRVSYDQQVAQSVPPPLAGRKPVGREVAAYGRTASLEPTELKSEVLSEVVDGGDGKDEHVTPGMSAPRYSEGRCREGLGPALVAQEQSLVEGEWRIAHCQAAITKAGAPTGVAHQDGTILLYPRRRATAGAGAIEVVTKERSILLSRRPTPNNTTKSSTTPFSPWPGNRFRPLRSTWIRLPTPTSADS